MVRIGRDLSIDESELEFEFARSSGPGGQNVNKLETKVTLRWPVGTSPSVDEQQRRLIEERLASRINRKGVLRVTSQRHRTREANRKAVLQRFAELVEEALQRDPPRKPTKVPKRAKRRRLEGKRQRSRKKSLRRPPDAEE